MNLRTRLRKLEVGRKREPTFVLFLDEGTDPPPEWLEREKARARRKNPEADCIFLDLTGSPWARAEEA